jgi:hypothetical protein
MGLKWDNYERLSFPIFIALAGGHEQTGNFPGNPG